MNAQQFESYLALARPDGLHVSLLSNTPLVYPRYDVPTGTPAAVIAYVARVTQAGQVQGEPGSTVAVSLEARSEGPHFAFWCGDRFTDGDMSYAEAVERCIHAAAPLANRHQAARLMMAGFGKHPRSQNCDFWARWLREKTPCEHVTAVVAHLRESIPDLRTVMLSAYKAAYQEAATSEFTSA